MSVLLFGAHLTANVLTLAHTSLYAQAGGFSEVQATELQMDRGSFVGSAGANSASMIIDALNTDNYGQIGVSGAGSTVLLGGGSIVNQGFVSASHGGLLELADNVSGSGQFDINTGGTLDLTSGTTMAAAQSIHLTGESASTLQLDPSNSSIAGNVYGFARSDLIELQNFKLSSFSTTSQNNPTVTFTGTEAFGGTALTFALNFQGNFSQSQIHFTSDVSGNGTIVYTDRA